LSYGELEFYKVDRIKEKDPSLEMLQYVLKIAVNTINCVFTLFEDQTVEYEGILHTELPQGFFLVSKFMEQTTYAILISQIKSVDYMKFHIE
jgi:hypothetical protein